MVRSSLSCGEDAHAVGIEDEGFDFGFGAVAGDFAAVPKEGDSGGIANFGDDFAVGADGGVGGGDESFLADLLAVGLDGNPGCFLGADHESQRRSRGFCWRRNGLGEISSGDIIIRFIAAGGSRV
jgi:hypothetical protein